MNEPVNTQEVNMDATFESWSCLNWPELIVAEAFSSDEPRDLFQLAAATEQPLDVVMEKLRAMEGEPVCLESRLEPEAIMRFASHLRRSAYWLCGRRLKERSQLTDTGDSAIVFTEWAGRIFFYKGAGRHARHLYLPEVRDKKDADKRRPKLASSSRHPAEAVESFQAFPWGLPIQDIAPG